MYANAFLKLLRLSSNSIASYKSRGRHCHCAAELRSLTRRADIIKLYRHTPLRRSVGDIKGVSKLLCVYHLYRNVFLAQTRIRLHFFWRFRKVFVTPNQNSFAFNIICKNHPESRLETLILRQKSDDKHTLRCTFAEWQSIYGIMVSFHKMDSVKFLGKVNAPGC